jgi:DNA recombination protein RmuC
VLDKVKKQLNTASRTIEQTGVRSRALERKLRTVAQLPEAEAAKMLALPDGPIPPEADEEDTADIDADSEGRELTQIA